MKTKAAKKREAVDTGRRLIPLCYSDLKILDLVDRASRIASKMALNNQNLATNCQLENFEVMQEADVNHKIHSYQGSIKRYILFFLFAN